jgi:hypothetical protein
MSIAIKTGSRIRVARLIDKKCPETRAIGTEGVVLGFVPGRVLVRFGDKFSPRLAYLPEELEAFPAGCLGCAANAPKTRDGRHHPGYNGRRFYTCRA